MKSLNKKIIPFVLINLILLGFNLLPILALAQSPGYQLLEPSIIINNPTPGETPSDYNLKAYLITAYLMLFVLVVAASVFFLILGGLEYILSDIPNLKIGGKKKIGNALLGLGIALSSYLLLKLISPALLNFDLVNL